MLALALLAIENESDRKFIERLYAQNYAVLLQKALGLLKDCQRAEDAVEAVMLKLIDRIDLLRACNRASLRSYLMTCVKNEALRQLRGDKKRYDFADADERLRTLPDEGEAIDSALLRRERVHALAMALKRLPERDREVLRMKYYERMSDAEIGEVLGLGASGVRALIGRARKKACALLRKEGEA